MVKKYVKEGDVSYALGATVTVELLKRRPECVRAVYVSPKSKIDKAIELAEKNGIPVIESEKAFNILSPKENCYVIGEFTKFETHISSDKNHVVLVNPSNGGNLGTIMRDVACFDCCDLAVIRPAVDPFDPKTVRASMGAAFVINFEMFDSFDEYFQKHGGRKIVPFMLDGAPLGKVKFDGSTRYSLVFGNEATGLPRSFERFGSVGIEQSDKADSLNLSSAVAIGLYKLATEI